MPPHRGGLTDEDILLEIYCYQGSPLGETGSLTLYTPLPVYRHSQE